MSCLALSPFIESPRLRLRGVCKSDLARLVELANDYDVVKNTGSMPFPYTLADAQAWYDRTLAADPNDTAQFVLEMDADGPIGTLGFFPGRGGFSEIGYWIGKPYWGQGLATEAAKSAVVWARDDWRRKALIACHNIDNQASGEVLIKAGFLYTGDVEPKFCKSRDAEVQVRWMVWLA